MGKNIFLGGGGEGYGQPQELALRYANRHGLIAGATGTGKTVTLQILAEGFSQAGVPVFLSDVKGDLSGLALPGSDAHKLHQAFMDRAKRIGFDDFAYSACPVTFWDLFGEQGHPVRTTVTEMGPLLLSRLMELSEAQEGILNIAFRVADEEGMPLLDLKDLQALLVWIGENRAQLSLRYGNVSTSSIGAIQRRLLVLENQGGTKLFGEPALDLSDLMCTDENGQGMVNILASDKLMAAPRLYATFLLWLLSELFEELPEVGDPDKPKLVFFFDEAHLLFDGAPKVLVDKVEQVARLIRSKGVGVHFITQNPADIPEDILGQLGNRVQHALRAFTARDRKNLRLAAETYRENPAFDTEAAIREVGVGEAVTSMLQKKVFPELSSAHWFVRRVPSWGPFLMPSGGPFSMPRQWRRNMIMKLIENRPLKSSRLGLRPPPRPLNRQRPMQCWRHNHRWNESILQLADIQEAGLADPRPGCNGGKTRLHRR